MMIRQGPRLVLLFDSLGFLTLFSTFQTMSFLARATVIVSQKIRGRI